MRYYYSRQLLMYNGHWYAWYPSEWAEQEASELGLLEELAQVPGGNAEEYSGGHDEYSDEEE